MNTNSSSSKENLISRLQKYIELIRNTGPITAFYLFGSYAAGRPTKMSDIDVAVLLDKSFMQEEYLAERLRLMGELSTILGTDAVELVILNETPANLAYRIIKDGELLFVREEGKSQLIDFKVKTMNRYFDFLPAQKMFAQALAKRTREGSFGGR